MESSLSAAGCVLQSAQLRVLLCVHPQVTSYNSDTLTLESSEKSAVQLLITDM